jgi:hypothetical protein
MVEQPDTINTSTDTRDRIIMSRGIFIIYTDSTNETYPPFGCSNYSFSSCLDANVSNIDLLSGKFQRYLTEAEIEMLRLANIKPTANGIMAAKLSHNGHIPPLSRTSSPRKNLRIPCWKPGRWKSLTA